MLFRLLLNLLRITPIVLILILLTVLVRGHGQRLSIDGSSPLAETWQQYALLLPLYLCGLIWFCLVRRKRKNRERRDSEEAKQLLGNLTKPSNRELRFLERINQWRLGSRVEGARPEFLLLNWQVSNRLELTDSKSEAEGRTSESVELDSDIEIERVGRYSVLTVSERLLSQRDPEETRLWQCLLDELKNSRPKSHSPVGVVLVLDAEHLYRTSAANLDVQALTLRARLEEIASTLGNAVPVQVVMDRCDLLPGYALSVQTLQADDRDLSIVCPLATNQRNLAHLVEAMVSQLDKLPGSLFDRLQVEPLTLARNQIYGFHKQWRLFGQVLKHFLQIAFREQRRVPQTRLHSLRFSGRLRDDVIGANEAAPELVRALQEYRPQGRLMTWLKEASGRVYLRVLYRLVVVLTVICVVLVLGNNYHHHLRQIEVMEIHLRALEAQRPTGNVPEGPELLTRLNNIRALAHPLEDRWPQPSFWLGQHQRLLAHAQTLYDHALKNALLPSLIGELKDRLQHTQNDSYELLRLYLMLGGQGPFDFAAVERWLFTNGHVGLGQALGAAESEALRGHLQALLSLLQEGPSLTVDEALVEKVRHRISREPILQRLYRQVSMMLDTPLIDEFSVASSSGSEGLLLFARRSDQPLSRGVPGRFTFKGYERFQANTMTTLTDALQDEEWVMGKGRQPDVLTLHPEIQALYQNDYIRHWERFFADLKFSGLDKSDQLSKRLKRLSGVDSALATLLHAAARETRLSSTPPPLSVLDGVRKQVSTLAVRVSPASTTEPVLALANEEHPVTNHFRPLHRFVEKDDGLPSQLDALRKTLAHFSLYIKALETAGGAGLSSPDVTAFDDLQQQIDQVPLLIQHLFTDVVSLGQSRESSRASEVVEANWARRLGPYCARVLKQRYPFERSAGEPVPLADFNRLFAPGGLLHEFSQHQLGGGIDTGLQPSESLREAQLLVPLAPGPLAQFQRAERIRQEYFPDDSGRARIDFELSPVTMDEGISQFSLTLDDQQLSYAHGPIVTTAFTWPAQALGGRLKAEVTLFDGRTLQRTAQGPWAWFRLLDQGSLGPSQSGDAQWLTLDFEGHKVVLQIHNSAVGNPFNSDAVSTFKCPSSLIMAHITSN